MNFSREFSPEMNVTFYHDVSGVSIQDMYFGIAPDSTVEAQVLREAYDKLTYDGITGYSPEGESLYFRTAEGRDFARNALEKLA